MRQRLGEPEMYDSLQDSQARSEINTISNALYSFEGYYRPGDCLFAGGSRSRFARSLAMRVGLLPEHGKRAVEITTLAV
jgi:hypothetical protein